MHHNDVEFWRHLQKLKDLEPDHEDLPSPRVCRLLLKIIEGWKSRPAWLTEEQVGHLTRGRADLTAKQKAEIDGKPIVIRKAMAIQRMLELVMSPDIARTAGTCLVVADELIVGTLPPFSVGQGKEFVRYLTEAEELKGALSYLNELSPMGHIVPNHGIVIQRGLSSIVKEARAKSQSKILSRAQHNFQKAVAISLQAVIDYAGRYAELVRSMAKAMADSNPNKKSLQLVADNLDAAPSGPAKTFHQALQAIYIVHCALHWTVEIVPIGRLDQLLAPFYKVEAKNGLSRATAQELIDCFWLKLDERVILKFRHAENRFTSSDGVLTGFFGPSNYDQGALLNQWMQQITVGGQLANDRKSPQDACNEVTELCLAAARRLPLNSPTLDLRVHKRTPDHIIRLAAKALLSGGAHPVLLNDDIIVPALANKSAAPIKIADARNYACDGCYETMVAGESEFSFGFVSALDLIEKTMNRGAGIAASGPVHLRGMKDSWRSKAARDIADYKEFQSILRNHMQLACHRYLSNLTMFYGNKESVAPSPLLSALIVCCLERSRDLTAGGAKYHIFSPLLVGVSNAADSLFVIKTLVFTKRLFSLDELLTCLATDWGNKLLQVNGGEVVAFGRHVVRTRIEEIRKLCLQAPKFGNGDDRVNEIAWWLLETFADCVNEAYQHPLHRRAFEKLADRYGSPNEPFVVHLAPGTGTFEQYVFSGSFNGASADGRRSCGPLGSDLSPAPVPNDMPAVTEQDGKKTHARQYQLIDGLRSYRSPVMQRFADGGPADYNIPERFALSDLVQMIRRFANGEGGSVCTFTVADPETLEAAQKDPENYNLVRVRMGGWTEFFVTLFPEHQEQHKRRPQYV